MREIVQSLYTAYVYANENKNAPDWCTFLIKNGVQGGARTPDRTLRRRMLYPTELLGH